MVTSDSSGEFEIEVSKKTLVMDLKRILLNKKNKPFFLKQKIENTQSVGDLLTAKNEYDKGNKK